MTASTYIRPRPLDDPALRVIGFHHAGGSAAVYYPLTKELPQDWDLVLLDLPGRGKRHAEPLMHSMKELLALAVEDVRPWTDVPYAIFGHSLGAVIAIEVARALEHQKNSPPSWVVVSGRAAPSFQGHLRSRLYELDDDSLLNELLSMGGTPDRIQDSAAFVEHFLRVARADLRAVDSYSPHPDRQPLSCPVTVFGGEADPRAPLHMLGAWSRETTGELHQRLFPGGHFYFLGEAFSQFARHLVEEVGQAAARDDL
jgi:surfactin synthase thioesterase subunit